MNVYEPGKLSERSCVIANGASLSGAINLLGERLVGIQMPSAWTTANITFQGSGNGTTFSSMKDAAGSELYAVTAASDWIVLDPAVFAGVGFIKLRSGTAGTPVNQGAERTITLITREV